MTAKRSPSSQNRVVYQEFGGIEDLDRSEQPVELAPQQQNLRVQASRKGRGGKTVTVISGFQAQSESIDALCKKLKNQCGAGGAVKDREIEIQGDRTVKILQILLELGYKAKISGG